MADSRITPRARRRMRDVVKWRGEGRTLAWIGQQLKVTRERVRQLEKLAEYEGIRKGRV